MRPRSPSTSIPALVVGLAALAAAGCESSPFSESSVRARDPACFETPEAALLALCSEKSDDAEELEDLAAVRALAHRRVEIVDVGIDRKLVLLGEERWELPLPLVKKRGGWCFDPAVGEQELLRRRIGRNELRAIATLRALAESDPDEQELHLAAAGTPPCEGYCYRLLRAPGPPERVAFLAWPSTYGDSGVMTFQVDDFGIVYEKDLGADTAAHARSIQAFDPDGTWDPCGAAAGQY
jgi:hypothetical protein